MPRKDYSDGYYIGDLSADGKRHGNGTFYWTNGDRYEGEYRNDKPDGYGKIYYADGRWEFGVYSNGTRLRVAAYGTSGSTSKKTKRATKSSSTPQSGTSNGGNNGFSGETHESGDSLTKGNGSNGSSSVAGIKTIVTKSGTYTGEVNAKGQVHGKGVFRFNDGASYEGEYKNGKKDGFGTFIFSNGEKYIGYYRKGVRNGLGTYMFADGCKYVGYFLNGSFNGFGRYYWPDGDWFEGEYRDDKRNGLGVYHFANGRWDFGCYIDEEEKPLLSFKDIDKVISSDNVETITYETSFYMGETSIVQGERVANGFGRIFYNNGKSYIDGKFVDGVAVDYVRMWLGEGRNIYGCWHQGFEGKVLFVDGNCAYVGEMQDGKIGFGKAHHYYDNGEWYDGEMKNGKRNGYGTYYFADGKWGNGVFLDDKLVRSEGCSD